MPGLGRAAHCRGLAAEGEYETAASLQVVSKNSTNPLSGAASTASPAPRDVPHTPGAPSGAGGDTGTSRRRRSAPVFRPPVTPLAIA